MCDSGSCAVGIVPFESSAATPFATPIFVSLTKPSTSMSRPSRLMKYLRRDQVFVPSPILNLLVSVSNPISPAARTGFAAVHWAANPLRCCILVAIF